MLDGLALVLAVAAVTHAATYAWWLAAGITFVVAHFFLFCNVFRIARSLELAWAAVFVLLVCGTVLTETPSWPWTVGISFAMTVIVIGLQMRRPTYHGLAWQWINPSLADWPPKENAPKGVAASSAND